MGLTSDFAISLNGHCFVCLSPLTQQTLDNAPEGLGSLNSIQCLSRFLKVDRRKVFNKTGVIPTHLVEKVEKARLMVDLCEDCACLNHKFFKLFKKLEKIKMEVATHLTIIRDKMLEGGEIDRRAMKLRRFADLDHDSNDKLSAKLEIAEVIRTDLMDKCSQRLNRHPPRVQLQRVTAEEIRRRRRIPSSRYPSDSSFRQQHPVQLNYKAFSNSEMSSSSIKLEPEHELMKSENDGNVSFDIDELSDQDNNSEVPDSVEINKCDATSSRYIRTKSGKFQCRLCYKVQPKLGSFHYHFRTAHLNIKFTCGVCGKQFTQKDNLNAHYQNKHLGRRFSCQFCSKTFSSPVNRYNHLSRTKCSRKNPYKGPGSRRRRPIQPYQHHLQDPLEVEATRSSPVDDSQVGNA